MKPEDIKKKRKGEYLEAKINEPATNSRNKNMRPV
jgi:hypothetical protein